jgi:hypothetical protein
LKVDELNNNNITKNLEQAFGEHFHLILIYKLK